MIELRNDIFIINTEDDRHIIYAPLRNVAFFANQNAVEIVQKYIDKELLSDYEKDSKVWDYLKQLERIKPNVPKKNSLKTEHSLVIILSQLCNLACSYCYAQESRAKEILDMSKLKNAIDHVLSYSNSYRKRFSFIGGGEPTLTWDLLKKAIEYIDVSKKEEQNVYISITTNGTLLSDEKIDFLKNHKVHIGISFEILPEIQNTQRKHTNENVKSFDIIDAIVKKLIFNNIPYSFRSTITRKNVGLMKEMVEFVSENYKNIKRLHFEQVTDNKDNNSDFYDDFIVNFFKAREIGKEKGITIYNSISNSIRSLRTRFCNGEFCVTPTGDIVSCHRVSSNKEDSFSSFNYGYINDEQIYINNSRVDKMINVANPRNEECYTCFAKWHCAGGCILEKLIHSEEQQSQKCNFTRNIIGRILEEKLVTQ